MKEHPRLFNDAMVRALLDDRKTQTRRIVSAHNTLVDGHGISAKRWQGMGLNLEHAWIDPGPSPAGEPGPYLKAPAGDGTVHRLYSRIRPGDRIWVREAHAFVPEPAYRRSTGIYQQINPADDYEACVYRENFDRARSFPWRPSIHMPRWASRILLDVVSVRAERLHELNAQDAHDEGCPGGHGSIPGYGYSASPGEHFRHVWQSINGPDSWEANPMVWVYEFRRVEQGGEA